MLAYLYLGLLGVYRRSVLKAEEYLIKSFESGCYFAANDLHTFYLGNDKEKSKYYYQEATRHDHVLIFKSKRTKELKENMMETYFDKEQEGFRFTSIALRRKAIVLTKNCTLPAYSMRRSSFVLLCSLLVHKAHHHSIAVG